ncbi:MAG: His/Gly/Thr/Pro-type tRNA ligase C-terminal domain-containing protein [Candidatus Saccharibacteria bacterium]
MVADANSVLSKSKGLGLRATVDNANESVGKKIRVAEVMKVPYVIVIGPKEAESGKVVPRIRQDLSETPIIDPIDIDEFLKSVHKEHSDRSIKSSL